MKCNELLNLIHGLKAGGIRAQPKAIPSDAFIPSAAYPATGTHLEYFSKTTRRAERSATAATDQEEEQDL